MLTALEKWPETGVPENPAAWLMTTAKNRGIDRIRRDTALNEKYGEIAIELEREEPQPGPESVARGDEQIGDDVLTLLFTACHPALTRDSQVALTLKAVGGLSTEEIARAFIVPKATIAQRIVRAKRTLRDSGIAFEIPEADETGPRLATVLGIIYLVFNEGYSATAGENWMRKELSREALRLGRILASLAPEEPEVHGLLALMEIQASRFPARIDEDGHPVLLMDQDRNRWDRLLIRRGLEHLERALELGGEGPYVLQAAVASCHARASRPEDTDWGLIVHHYDKLANLGRNPVIELNRAVAINMAGDPSRALIIVDGLNAGDELDGYHLLPAVRGELLEKLDRQIEAAVEFRRAAEMTGNRQERRVLMERAEQAERFSG